MNGDGEQGGGKGWASRSFPGEKGKAWPVEVRACAKGWGRENEWQVRGFTVACLAGAQGTWKKEGAGKTGDIGGQTQRAVFLTRIWHMLHDRCCSKL